MPTFTMRDVVRDDDRTVQVTRRCEWCRQDVEVYVRPRDWAAYVAGYGYIQALFPYLTAAELELIMNGFCGPCFDAFCPPDEE